MDGSPIFQLDGDFSAANSLAGKAGERMAAGVAEHAVEGRFRYAIESVRCVENKDEVLFASEDPGIHPGSGLGRVDSIGIGRMAAAATSAASAR